MAFSPNRWFDRSGQPRCSNGGVNCIELARCGPTSQLSGGTATRGARSATTNLVLAAIGGQSDFSRGAIAPGYRYLRSGKQSPEQRASLCLHPVGNRPLDIPVSSQIERASVRERECPTV